MELAPRSPGRQTGTAPLQVYDMNADPSERHNVQADHPEVVKDLIALLERYVDEVRSTPGTPQKNAGPVDSRK